MSKLKDKVLLLAGCGMASHEIAEVLKCHAGYVRSTISQHKRKMRMARAEKAEEALEATR